MYSEVSSNRGMAPTSKSRTSHPGPGKRSSIIRENAHSQTKKNAKSRIQQRISQVGRKFDAISLLVPTDPGGRRLTRYAPARILYAWVADIPVRLLRMLPVSLAVSAQWKRPGGAKSRAV
jgi:hypothetical protein